LWHEGFRRVSRDQHSQFAWQPRTVDLGLLRTQLDSRIGGGWFGDMAVARVESAGIFGPEVASSDEWERYEQVGRLNAIILELSFADDDFKVMVSQDSTVLIYRDLGEFEALAFLREVLGRIEGALN